MKKMMVMVLMAGLVASVSGDMFAADREKHWTPCQKFTFALAAVASLGGVLFKVSDVSCYKTEQTTSINPYGSSVIFRHSSWTCGTRPPTLADQVMSCPIPRPTGNPAATIAHDRVMSEGGQMGAKLQATRTFGFAGPPRLTEMVHYDNRPQYNQTVLSYEQQR